MCAVPQLICVPGCHIALATYVCYKKFWREALLTRWHLFAQSCISGEHKQLAMQSFFGAIFNHLATLTVALSPESADVIFHRAYSFLSGVKNSILNNKKCKFVCKNSC